MEISERAKSIKSSYTIKMGAKVIALKEAGYDVINLSVGEPDFPTPHYIKDAAYQCIKANKTKYTANQGLFDLREAISEKLISENEVHYFPDQILVSNGAKQSLFNVVMSLVQAGDEVIVPAPFWGSYPEIVRLSGATPVIVPTKPDNNFHITPRTLEDTITESTKIFILCNPGNPTGSVYSEKKLMELAEVLVNKKIVTISDEIYEKLLYDKKYFTSFASISQRVKENTVIINGLSKSYAMTGWRVGYAAGPKDLIDAAAKIQSHNTSAASSIAQYAALAALRGPRLEMQKMVREFEKRRDFLVQELAKIPDLRFSKPQGAFYLFPDISAFVGKKSNGQLIKDSVDLATYLLEKFNVAIVPGAGFGMEGFIRISYSTSMDKLKEGIRRLSRGLKNLKP